MRMTPNNEAVFPPSERAAGKIERVQISTLKVHEQNARTHSNKQLRQIARSIERFGFVNPILIDRSGKIICGHGREITVFPWKEPPDLKARTLNRVRTFLKQHQTA
jgi:hypothetical protein